jgi:predicted transcriptional regulator
MASRPFSLRLPEEVSNDLKFLSSAMNRSQSSIAAEVLAENIAEKVYRIRAIQDAKEEAKKGAFISQEAMEKWVASLGTDNELPTPEPDIFVTRP